MVSGNLKVWALLIGGLVAAPVATAQDEVAESEEVRPDEPPQPVLTPIAPQGLDALDLPVPTLELERIPARTSYELAVQVSFGRVAYFEDVMDEWPGFGIRGSWGKNAGRNHRFGFTGLATIEGEFGIYTLLTLEPGLDYDYVGKRGFLLGLSGGPSFAHTRDNLRVNPVNGFALAPFAAARIGWSQTYSSVGRRLFVFLEPKVRFTEFGPVPLAAVVVGSGGGR